MEKSSSSFSIHPGVEWSRGRILGRGSSADVYLASRGGDVCAVKSAELCHSVLLQREKEIVSALNSPYVVGYRGWDVTKEDDKLVYNVFMEYMAKGTLSDQIRRHGGRLEESVIAFYTRQILQGLEYLHSNGVVHCDLKGSNVLISGEDEAKVADFGCATRVLNSGKAVEAEVMRGTPMFMAPEVARGEEQQQPCDIWALGCTVIEMATGLSPWTHLSDPVSVLYRIAYSGESPELPSFLSPKANDFLGKCFNRNPTERWSAAQLLRHPFLEIHNGITKQLQKSNSISPTSILDSCFWNSVAESDTWSSSNLNSTSFENSASERVRELASVSGEPSWTWDERWITIREGNMKNNITQTRTTGNYMDDHHCRKASSVISIQKPEMGIDKMLPNSRSAWL